MASGLRAQNCLYFTAVVAFTGGSVVEALRMSLISVVPVSVAVRRLVFGFLAVLFGILAASAPAQADFASARREFGKLDIAKQAKVSLGLIATGDFDGLAGLGFTKRLYNAIITFQRREGMNPDGTLDAQQIEVLVDRFQKFAADKDIRRARNPMSGSEALIPFAMFDTQDKTHRGIVFNRKDAQLQISFETFAGSEVSFKQLYDQMSGPKAEKFVEYKTYKPQYFVVSGLFEGKHFYMYMAATPSESTGFVVTYDTSMLVLGQRTAVLMANSFTAQDGPGVEDNLPPGAEGPAEPPPLPPKSEQPPETQPAVGSKEPPPPPGNSTGTGFRITEAGHVMTNFHVAGQCKKLRLHRIGETPVDASLVARDEVNDLAIIKAASPLPGTIATFSGKGAVRAGSEIVVFGFPLTGLLSDSGNFTTGNITSMAGMGNDSRLFQISAPVQSGNSGGPVLDRTGGVVAVIVSKLNAMGVANQTGDVPQNVNFAIKSNVALGFVDGVGILTTDSPKDAVALDTPTLAERARDFTFLIECNND